ncbi:MAG: glutamate synthase [Segetibacter sp.]|nr:glutamate synthase [Segetibacter sp.]
MSNKEKNIPVSGTVILLLVFINALILKIAFIGSEKWYWALSVTLPLLLLCIYKKGQKKSSILSNNPGILRRRDFEEYSIIHTKQHPIETDSTGERFVGERSKPQKK